MKRNNKLIGFLTMLMTCGILTSFTAFPVMAYSGSETDTSEEATIIREETTEETENDDSTAFSVEGNGTLTDEADSSQNKLFYIVTTANGNSYYIIIDKDSSTNNVYMLSQIDEADLADFTEETDSKKEDSVTTDSPEPNAESGTDLSGGEVENPVQKTDNETSPDAEDTDTKASDSDSSAGKYIGYVLLGLACVGVIAAYYFLKVRNRDEQEEEDETAYGDDEQPDDIYDPESEEMDEEEEPEEDVENNDALSDDSRNTPEEGNVPFVDYPDPEDYPEKDNKDKN